MSALGFADDIHIALWRGAYVIHNIVVRFRAPGIERKEALVLNDIHFSLRNLTNALPADDQRA